MSYPVSTTVPIPHPLRIPIPARSLGEDRQVTVHLLWFHLGIFPTLMLMFLMFAIAIVAGLYALDNLYPTMITGTRPDRYCPHCGQQFRHQGSSPSHPGV